MKRLFLSLLYLFAIALFFGCSGSKSLSKKAAKLEEAGMYSDAADFYYESLIKNPQNVNARIGLNKTGDKVLNDKLGDFFKEYQSGNTKSAVYSYIKAKDYSDKLKRVGLEMSIPSQYTTDFTTARQRYVDSLYTAGSDLLAAKQFSAANSLFDEIGQLMPHYKDASNLEAVSKCEPLYIDGNSAMDVHQYRKAYNDFDQIIQILPNYKDASDLKQEALDKGRLTVSVAPFQNGTGNPGIEKSAQSYVVDAITKINDPFLRLVERENIQQILNEQRLNMSGMVDRSTASSVGSLLGAKALLTGTVVTYSENYTPVRVVKQRGYEAYQVKLLNKETNKYVYQTRYKPVYYYNHSAARQVNLGIQYKLISLETGEILASDIVHKSTTDQMQYVTYPGEVTRLYPASGENVNTSRIAFNQLQQLVRAPRSLQTAAQLASVSLSAVANTISQSVEQYAQQQ